MAIQVGQAGFDAKLFSTEPGARSHLLASQGSPATIYLREFFVEIAGSLIPGFLFAVVSVPTIGALALLTLSTIHGSLHADALAVKDLLIDLDPVRFELLALLLVVSYVIGSVFSRQDIKTVDEISAKRLLNRFPGVQKDWVVQYDEHSRIDVQFPYLFLYEYLTHRGLDELASLVPWRGEKPTTYHQRSKMFFNQLKIRLQLLLPDKCNTIIRNEAHIRMMASTWHAARALSNVAKVTGGLAAALLLIGWLVALARPHVTELCALATWSALLWLFMWWIKSSIEQFIHYQRVREIVWVLETVHFAELNGYAIVNHATPHSTPEAAMVASFPKETSSSPLTVTHSTALKSPEILGGDQSKQPSDTNGSDAATADNSSNDSGHDPQT